VHKHYLAALTFIRILAISVAISDQCFVCLDCGSIASRAAIWRILLLQVARRLQASSQGRPLRRVKVEAYFMVARCNRAGHLYFCPVVSFFFFFFFVFYVFSSPNLIGRILDVYHTPTHGVAQVRVGVSQTLRRWTEGATYIRQGDHHLGHWPTF